jgi:hypothetical protein
MGGRMKRMLLAAFILMSAQIAAAQTLADPMRPPAAFLAPAANTPTQAAKPTGPIVHTIIIGPGRRYATIDGRTVTEGDTVRGMRVTRIAEAGVVLRDATGQNVALELLPAVGKNASAFAQSERNAISVRAPRQ